MNLNEETAALVKRMQDAENAAKYAEQAAYEAEQAKVFPFSRPAFECLHYLPCEGPGRKSKKGSRQDENGGGDGDETASKEEWWRNHQCHMA